jgi:hypothetical protein
LPVFFLGAAMYRFEFGFFGIEDNLVKTFCTITIKGTVRAWSLLKVSNEPL